MVTQEGKKRNILVLFVMSVTEKLKEHASNAWHALTMIFVVIAKKRASILSMKCWEYALQQSTLGKAYGTWFLDQEEVMVAEDVTWEEDMVEDLVTHHHGATSLGVEGAGDHQGVHGKLHLEMQHRSQVKRKERKMKKSKKHQKAAQQSNKCQLLNRFSVKFQRLPDNLWTLVRFNFCNFQKHVCQSPILINSETFDELWIFYGIFME